MTKKLDNGSKSRGETGGLEPSGGWSDSSVPDQVMGGGMCERSNGKDDKKQKEILKMKSLEEIKKMNNLARIDYDVRGYRFNDQKYSKECECGRKLDAYSQREDNHNPGYYYTDVSIECQHCGRKVKYGEIKSFTTCDVY